jgi:predicted dehydrogenase
MPLIAEYRLNFRSERIVSIKVGVIGTGYLGQHHARIYAELEETELVAVTDSDLVRAREVAGRYGCRAVGDYRDLLEQCDAVSIVTPTSTHREIAMACLGAGKDVLVEKPLTVSTDDARAIIEQAERCGRLLQVGHLERYNPAVTEAWQMLQGAGLIECERLSPFLGRATDVDVTLDLMIHDVDVVMALMGARPVRIRAAGRRLMTEKIDAAKAWLEFDGGGVAVLTASRLSNEKKRILTAHNREGYLVVDYQEQTVTRCFRKGGELCFDVMKPQRREPLKEELADFVDCVRTRREPRVSGREAAAALEVVLEITEIIKAHE